MDIPLHLCAVLARHRLWLLPVVMLLVVASPSGARRRWLWRTAIVVSGIGIFLGAPLLADWGLYRFGRPATARISGTYKTWIQVNDHDVVGYDVLIRAAPDTLVESRFEDDEVNLYPLADFSTPQPDETFGVRYLPRFPRDFVMLTDDASPWVRRQRCDALSLRLTAAQQRFEFAHGATPYRQPYVAAIDAYLRQGCAPEPYGPASFQQDRARALAGQVGPGG